VLIVPRVEFPPATALTDHCTGPLTSVSVAVNWDVAPVITGLFVPLIVIPGAPQA
jgi:hypothetical protein